jgi:uncharacterized coiled-coil protein SlyX
MAKETNWHKHVAIGTYILIGLTVVLIAFAVLTFVRPPDPEHPMSMDFMTRSVTLSPWIIGAGVIGLVAITRWIVRKRTMAIVINRKPNYGTGIGGVSRGTSTPSPRLEIEERDKKIAQLETDISALHADRRTRRITNLETENATLNANIAGLQDELATAQLVQQGHEAHIAGLTDTLRSLEEEKNKAIHENARILRNMDGLIDGFVGSDLLRVKGNAGDPFHFNPECEQIILQWPELIGVQIDAYKNETGFGFVLYMMNSSDDYLAQYTIEIAEANAWSVHFQKFLPNLEVKRDMIIKDGNLRPLSMQEKGQWLVRVQHGGDQLVLGGNQKLQWSNNDPTSVEIWRLSLGVAYYPGQKPPIAYGQTLKGVSTKFILVRWDRTERSLQIAEWIDPQAAKVPTSP